MTRYQRAQLFQKSINKEKITLSLDLILLSLILIKPENFLS